MAGFLRHIVSGLRWRLLLLVLLVCAPLVGWMLHTAGEDRRRQIEDWKQRSQEMVQLAMRQEDELVAGTRQLLHTLAESPQVRSGSRGSCKKLLNDVFGSNPRFANLGVVRTNGVFLFSVVAPTRPANQTSREYFRRVLETREFATGDFPDGRTGGRSTVNFGYPVFAPSGQIQAVVFAAVDLDWFNRFESALMAQLPKEATWTEVDRSGRILVRYPSPEQWIGRPVPESSLLEMTFGRHAGVVEFKNTESVPGFYAFARMHSQFVPGDVVAILGIPRHVLFAGADRTLIRNLVGLGIAAGLALTLGWVSSSLLVLRPVRALVRSTARLAVGDSSINTRPHNMRDELGQLARTFDQMTQAVQQREIEFQRANDKLHLLSRRLVAVQETERRHIARELHDEIGQSLTVAELNLQATLQSLDHDALAPRLKESLEVVERVLEQVHDLSLNLRPSMLDDLGLEPALRWYLNRQAKLAGLRARFRMDALEHRLDPVIETECFRVAQEALTNVARHARANAVTMELYQENGCIHLRVCDDGVGFDVAAVLERAAQGASLGVLSMQERAALVGGGLEYMSGPQGTEIHAWFPLRWQTQQSWPEVTDNEEFQKNHPSRSGR